MEGFLNPDVILPQPMLLTIDHYGPTVTESKALAWKVLHGGNFEMIPHWFTYMVVAVSRSA